MIRSLADTKRKLEEQERQQAKIDAAARDEAAAKAALEKQVGSWWEAGARGWEEGVKVVESRGARGWEEGGKVVGVWP
eukprot:365879-Chlamydomonas_euryale.AAC.7